MTTYTLFDNSIQVRESLNRQTAISTMNSYGSCRIPFFFMISYDTNESIIFRVSQQPQTESIRFSFPHQRNFQPTLTVKTTPNLKFDPPDKSIYSKQFNRVQQEMQLGNIYLLNLTRSTPVHSDAALEEIFFQANAKYKVYYPGHFVVFSPETFVRIQDGIISTHPMKGTIRVDQPNALEMLRRNEKERAEHASVVDLLRNDLGQVADWVHVSQFRYFEKINAGEYELWQTSSEIKGQLPDTFHQSLGDLIFSMLPAGSISGVPKNKALDIIREVENHDRGFYTGIAGIFDGHNLDSCVMIRFIENTPAGLVYKSGGGIHRMSDLESEYQEMIQKIYVPVY